MSRILVTGSEGFVGKHLTPHLLEEGHEVVGVSRASNPRNDALSDHVRIDLLDFDAVSGIDFEEFSAVIHTAANASQRDSYDDPRKYIFENQQTTCNLLEAARLRKTTLGRFVIVSTASVYSGSNSMPITEASKVGDPKSPYAVGKIGAELVAQYYRHAGLDLVIARPFNHTGPGQSTGYLLADLYEKITRAMQQDGAAAFGNLEARRDYTDVRDVVRAYGLLALAHSLENEVYNISSGHAISGTLMLSLLAEQLGYALPEQLDRDHALTRKDESSVLVGDSSLIKHELGWSAEIPIEKTVKDFVEDKKSS